MATLTHSWGRYSQSRSDQPSRPVWVKNVRGWITDGLGTAALLVFGVIGILFILFALTPAIVAAFAFLLLPVVPLLIVLLGIIWNLVARPTAGEREPLL